MNPSAIRNRVVRHVRVRAGDLVPHENNTRVHPQMQRRALADLYAEVGFARSLLAYELPDGRLKLIDGHLRQSLTPDMLVDVEVLDVTDDEARKLLLSLDPLAALAEHDQTRLDALQKLTHSDSDALNNLWRSLGSASAEVEETLERSRRKQPELPAVVRPQYFVLVECADEAAQLALLERFQSEGLTCRALLS
jgi:hypothetical protein